MLADRVSRYLPDQREELHLSFALADPENLELLFVNAGLQDVRVERELRQDTIDSFADYWEPIEAGTGQLPQAYLALPEPSHRAVRDEVRARLAQFESQGRLVMSVEMLIRRRPGAMTWHDRPWSVLGRVRHVQRRVEVAVGREQLERVGVRLLHEVGIPAIARPRPGLRSTPSAL